MEPASPAYETESFRMASEHVICGVFSPALWLCSPCSAQANAHPDAASLPIICSASLKHIAWVFVKSLVEKQPQELSSLRCWDAGWDLEQLSKAGRDQFPNSAANSTDDRWLVNCAIRLGFNSSVASWCLLILALSLSQVKPQMAKSELVNNVCFQQTTPKSVRWLRKPSWAPGLLVSRVLVTQYGSCSQRKILFWQVVKATTTQL